MGQWFLKARNNGVRKHGTRPTILNHVGDARRQHTDGEKLEEKETLQ
jgi:hypothetical protein